MSSSYTIWLIMMSWRWLVSTTVLLAALQAAHHVTALPGISPGKQVLHASSKASCPAAWVGTVQVGCT